MKAHLLIAAALLASVYTSYTPEHVIVDVTNEFGACVLKLVASRTENVAFSPYGLVSVALVLYEGTNGPTAAEIHNTLRLPWDRHVTRIGFRDLHRYLKSYFTNDGFLRGLVLSKPNVLLNKNYTTQLQFYGFDLKSERPTKPPLPPAQPGSGTTSAPFTLAPTTVRSTARTTLVTVTETPFRTTTEIRPQETTIAPTAKETTKPDVTTAMATETEVESKDMDEDLPQVPNETTKTVPTEGMTAKATNLPTTEVEPTTAKDDGEITTEEPIHPTTASTTSPAENTNPTPEITTAAVAQTEPSVTSTQTTTIKIETSPEVTAAPTTMAFTPPPTTTAPPTTTTTNPPTESTSPSPQTTTSPQASPETTNPPLPATTIPPTTNPPPPPPTNPPTTTNSPSNTIPNAEPTASSDASPETESNPPSASEDPSTATPEVTQATEGMTQVPPVAETDNVPSESERVTRLERALYHKGYERGGVPNWVPNYEDPRWSYQPPLENWFFTPAGGERVPVITYTAYLPFAHIHQLSALALQLPLDDPRYFMVILLPEEREGLGQLLFALQWCPVRGIVNQLKTTAVYATVPSFTIVKHINLVPPLTKLGMVRVFDSLRADLTPMSSEPGLYVRTVEQVVTVSLRKYFANHRWFDATPGDVEEHFIANHPFAYFVVDRETQVTLMAGTIVNPVAHNQ